jgi:hypothetical protein
MVTQIDSIGKPSALGSIDIQSMPVDTIAFYLAISQTDKLDDEIKYQLDSIRTRQTTASEAGRMKIELQQLKSQIEMGGLPEIPPDVRTWMNKNGITLADNPQKAGLRDQVKRMQGELDQLNGDLAGMVTLKKDLEGLKQNNMEHIRTGDRVILGRRPDLMLKLEKYGVMPPIVGGGPYDRFAKQQAAQGAAPYDKQEYADLANRLPSGWEELSAGEMDRVISGLQAKINAKQTEIVPKQTQLQENKNRLSDLISQDLDLSINNINGFTKDMNGSIELDMLNIQSLMSKRNQALEMSSAIMKKSAESKQSIIRNI